MRRLLATAALLGALLAVILGVGVVSAAPAAASVSGGEEIEIVTGGSNPELSASTGAQVESGVAATFIMLLIGASAAGPWLVRTTAAELDRRLRPLPVRSDERVTVRQH